MGGDGTQVECEHCKRWFKPAGLNLHLRSCQPARQHRSDEERERVRRRVERDLRQVRDGYAQGTVDFDAGLRGFEGSLVHDARASVSDQLMARPSLRDQHRILVQRTVHPPPEEAHADDADDADLVALEEGRSTTQWYDNVEEHDIVINIHDYETDSEDEDEQPNDDDTWACRRQTRLQHQRQQQEEEGHSNDNDNDDGEESEPPTHANVHVPGTHPDPYHPSHFDEDAMNTHLPKANNVDNVQDNLLAQLDLYLLLDKAGCPLNLHDKIIGWLDHYTTKNKTLFSDVDLLRRDGLISAFAKLYDTEDRRPDLEEVQFDYDGRVILLPRFQFVAEIMSLLHDETIMAEENLVDGYDPFTGLVNGQWYWVDETINEEDFFAHPTPTNGNLPLSEVPHGTKFQKSAKRFCTEPHHMPIPLVFFYDKANLDRFGALACSPLIFSFGFFKNCARARRMFWRILALVPNLGVGKGKSNKKTANEKSNEHHKVLKKAFEEFIAIVNAGGFKTVFRGRTVVLKFWVQFIIGDTEGHNDLCGHFNKHTKCKAPVRDCHCGPNDLATIPPQCTPITLKEVADGQAEDMELGQAGKTGSNLHSMSQRPMEDNVFDHLPMANEKRGIHACTNFETLHVMDQGLYKHICKLIDDFISDKTNKDKLNEIFRTMSGYLDRQSERDFPRRATRFAFTDGTCITATESKGNMLCLLLVLMTRDGFELVEQHLRAVPGNKTSVASVISAIEGLLAYEKWVNQTNAVSEVLHARKHIEATMKKVLDTFPRDGLSSVAWDIPKFHGALARLDVQMVADGSGAAWTSAHGENFHKELVKKNARNTQMRVASLAKQMANRVTEGFPIEIAARTLQPRLMPNHEIAAQMLATPIPTTVTTRETRSYMNPNIEKVQQANSHRGKFSLVVPGLMFASTQISEMGTAPYEIKWKNKYKHSATGNKTFSELVIGISNWAIHNHWLTEVICTGYTTMKKRDPTTGDKVTYRADPKWLDKEWRDWAIVDSYPAGTNLPNVGGGDVGNFCPGWICGFVTFDQPGFPTPNRIERRRRGIFNPTVDPDLYAIVRCANNTMEFDKKFVSRFQLQDTVESMYVLPMWAIIGPLAVVPDMHTGQFRTLQDKDAFIAVKPYRLWGDHFGRRIRDDTGVADISDDRTHTGLNVQWDVEMADDYAEDEE